jgi:ATP/maltotriose-dependent transcriptional regulator MalT
LTRLLLEGELCELGAGQLALTADEVTAALYDRGQAVQPWAVNELLARTGGWYTGIRLHLLGAGQGHEADVALLQRYLEEEVLGVLPTAWQRTLCTLACLPEFDAALCEHLLATIEGAPRIDQLYDCGQFIEVLDNRHQRFRVWPALAGMLARQVAVAPKRALYRRACGWYRHQHRVRPAIELALLACDVELAAELLQQLPLERLFQGRELARVLSCCESLPPDLLCTTPSLLILDAWALLLSGRLDAAAQSATRLQRHVPQPGARQQRELLAQWQVLTAMIAAQRGRPLPSNSDLGEALTLLPPAALAQQLMSRMAFIELAQVDAHLETAHDLNGTATRLARECGSLGLETLLVLQQVQLLDIRGELTRAEKQLRQLHGELNGTWAEPDLLWGRTQVRLGGILLKQGRYTEAAGHFQNGVHAGLACADPLVIEAYIGLAEIDAAADDLDQAFTRLAQAKRLMQRRNIAEPLYMGSLVLAYGKLWLQQGRPERAVQALEKCLLHYRGAGSDKPPFGSPELVQRLELLFCQVRTALGQDVRLQLESMLKRAITQGRRTLVCELWLSLAEAQYAQNLQGKAQMSLLDGLALARQIGLNHAQRVCSQRTRGLMRWGKDVFNDSTVCTAAVLLSQRELSVLEMISRGLSNQEIAESLFISLHTVKSHAQKINVKLGVSRRTQAVVRAKMLGLVA